MRGVLTLLGVVAVGLVACSDKDQDTAGTATDDYVYYFDTADGGTGGGGTAVDGGDDTGNGGGVTLQGEIYSGSISIDLLERNSGSEDVCSGSAELGLDDKAFAGNITCTFAGDFKEFGATDGTFEGTVDGSGSATGSLSAFPFNSDLSGSVTADTATLSFAGAKVKYGKDMEFSGTMTLSAE